MKRSARLGRVRVSADGEGVVSHAGAELFRELAGYTGLVDAWDRALIGTYKGLPVHFPGSVLADVAVAIIDGADSISDLRSLREQPGLFGPVASTPTAWRVLDRVSEAHLPGLRAGRAIARQAAWAAGAAFLALQSCLGLEICARESRIYLYHSALPECLQHLLVKNLHVGEACVDLAFERYGETVGVNIARRTGKVEIVAIR